MKKIFFVGIAALAITAVVAFNVNLSLNQENEMSVLELANIEALGQNENGGGGMYYVNPCPTRPGAECSSKKYDDENRCSNLTYC